MPPHRSPVSELSMLVVPGPISADRDADVSERPYLFLPLLPRPSRLRHGLTIDARQLRLTSLAGSGFDQLTAPSPGLLRKPQPAPEGRGVLLTTHYDPHFGRSDIGRVMRQIQQVLRASPDYHDRLRIQFWSGRAVPGNTFPAGPRFVIGRKLPEVYEGA